MRKRARHASFVKVALKTVTLAHLVRDWFVSQPDCLPCVVLVFGSRIIVDL